MYVWVMVSALHADPFDPAKTGSRRAQLSGTGILRLNVVGGVSWSDIRTMGARQVIPTGPIWGRSSFMQVDCALIAVAVDLNLI